MKLGYSLAASFNYESREKHETEDGLGYCVVGSFISTEDTENTELGCGF